jgi:hypothetical protein
VVTARWKRIIVLPGSGALADRTVASQDEVVAAELKFRGKNATWHSNLSQCRKWYIQWRLKFAIGSWTNDNCGLLQAREPTGTPSQKPRPSVERRVALAEAAWRHFTCCMSALSPEQAAPLWQAAHEQAAARIAP